LIILLGSATIVFAVGLVDDLKGLPARIKLLAELLTAAGVCLLGIRIPEVTLTEEWSLPLGSWSYVVTILWLAGITNAVNLSDGLDGLAAGIGIIACSSMALCAWHSGNMMMSVLMLALAGSLSGFLTFNFYPARIFMGDSGSLFLGFMIAVSSVACTMPWESRSATPCVPYSGACSSGAPSLPLTAATSIIACWNEASVTDAPCCSSTC
jgi:UDP-GlcNAc:undecaprenyl-phosphate GlcNAc-1-phosphate transferase